MEESGLASASKELEKVQTKYTQVEDYLYTLKVTNLTEYDYFENLKDANGKDMEITINIWDEGDKRMLNGCYAHTGGFAQITTGTQIIPTSNNGVNVNLYEANQYLGADGVLRTNKGNNYPTLCNELGDIKYFFDNVKDAVSYTFWFTTCAPDPNNPNEKRDKIGYYDPKGAGQYSFDYENNRKSEVDNYQVTGTETKDTKHGTIKP